MTELVMLGSERKATQAVVTLRDGSTVRGFVQAQTSSSVFESQRLYWVYTDQVFEGPYELYSRDLTKRWRGVGLIATAYNPDIAVDIVSDEMFQPDKGFDSPSAAVAYVCSFGGDYEDKIKRALTIVESNISFAEFGFASELVTEMQTIE